MVVSYLVGPRLASSPNLPLFFVVKIMTMSTDDFLAIMSFYILYTHDDDEVEVEVDGNDGGNVGAGRGLPGNDVHLHPLHSLDHPCSCPWDKGEHRLKALCHN